MIFTNIYILSKLTKILTVKKHHNKIFLMKIFLRKVCSLYFDFFVNGFLGLERKRFSRHKLLVQFFKLAQTTLKSCFF